MNKIAKLMCLVAVIALVGTSCKKKEEAVSCQGTFMEMNQTEEGSKTYKVGNRIEWDATDKVELFNVPNNNSTCDHGTYSVSGAGGWATFVPGDHAIGVSNQGAFYGFYPSGNAGNAVGGFQDAWAGDGHVTGLFLLPPVQQYRTINGVAAIPQGALAAAAKDTQTPYLGDVRFNFQAINGVLVLSYWYQPSMAATKKVDYITVTDNRVNISGLVQMYIDKINTQELETWLNQFNPDDEVYMANLLQYKNQIGYYVPDPSVNPYLSRTVTLQCRNAQFPNGVTLGTSPSTATVFNIALRPGAFSRGMIITVHYTDGTYHVPYSFSTNNMIRPNTNMILRTREVAYRN